MSDVLIKVDTNKMVSTADTLSGQGKTVISYTDEMVALATTISTYWTGEASQTYVTKLKKLQNDITIMNNMIQEQVQDLKSIAQTYAATEKSNIEQSNALLNDVLK